METKSRWIIAIAALLLANWCLLTNGDDSEKTIMKKVKGKKVCTRGWECTEWSEFCFNQIISYFFPTYQFENLFSKMRLLLMLLDFGITNLSSLLLPFSSPMVSVLLVGKLCRWRNSRPSSVTLAAKPLVSTFFFSVCEFMLSSGWIHVGCKSMVSFFSGCEFFFLPYSF